MSIGKRSYCDRFFFLRALLSLSIQRFDEAVTMKNSCKRSVISVSCSIMPTHRVVPYIILTLSRSMDSVPKQRWEARGLHGPEQPTWTLRVGIFSGSPIGSQCSAGTQGRTACPPAWHQRVCKMGRCQQLQGNHLVSGAFVLHLGFLIVLPSAFRGNHT